MHLDPDEIFLPGGPLLSITDTLRRQPAHTPAVRFMNFEGQPECGDVVNRYEQVTLFKAHKHFITEEAFYWRNRFKLGKSATLLNLYANGKSAVRVNAPGVHHMGPHFFTGSSPDERWISPDNPEGKWVDAISDEAVVLHYAYSYLQDVREKSARSCPDEYKAAAQEGHLEALKQCFIIDFDRDAFVANAEGQESAENFFFSRMVMTEGSIVRCMGEGGGKIEVCCHRG